MIGLSLLLNGTNKSNAIKKKVYSFLFILSILVSVWLGLSQINGPDVVELEADRRNFSAERAKTYLKEIAANPHPVGSNEHKRVKKYIVSELAKLGVKPEIQVVESGLYIGETPYEGEVENILAYIKGEEPSGTIMLTSHYDSVPGSFGAADAGASVAAIIETVRALSHSPELKNNLVILISDGEEIGLLGAQAFAQFHPWAHEVEMVLNFEARGSSGPSVMFETSNGNNKLIREFINGTNYPLAHSFINELYKTMPNDTDLSIYKEAGNSGLNFAFFGNVHTYHSADDTVENLSLRSLQYQGENMLDLVRYFGNMNVVSKDNEGNSVYFNSFGTKVISYPEYLVIPFMCMAIILFFLTAIVGILRRKLTILGLSGGIVLFLLMLVMAYFLGNITKSCVETILSESSWAMGLDLRMSHPLFITMILVMMGLFLLAYKLARKKINVNNLAVGALFVLMFIVIYTSLLIKGSSYIFLWPTLIGLIGLNVQFYVKGKWKWFSRGITLVITFFVIMFITPIVYLTYMLLTLDNVEVLLVFTALLWAFFIPLGNFNRGDESLCEST
jgi:Peptidase family M28